jgi:hypothetical protein
MVIPQMLGRIHRDTLLRLDNKIVATILMMQQFCCFVKSWIGQKFHQASQNKTYQQP